MTNTYIQVGDQTVDGTTQKPDNRVFRYAWQLDGEVIEIDMIKAREIYRDMLRAKRESVLLNLDSLIAKSIVFGSITLNSNNPSDVAKSEKAKISLDVEYTSVDLYNHLQMYLDITDRAEIENAQTTDELMSLTILGLSVS